MMMKDTYTVADLAQDLRNISRACNDPQEIIMRVKPCAERAALNPAWLQPEHYTCDPEQGFGVHLLHEEADHRLAIFALSWLPGRGAPPHNHGTWAVVAGVDGMETNTFWKRLDDESRPGYADLVYNGEKAFGPGEVIAMLPHELHSVTNETEAVTVSLHIYGKHLNYTGRSQFDVKRKTEKPFIVKEQ
jgi:predicted metal-dependent enzyme (double-stranded beta helix superfamily)